MAGDPVAEKSAFLRMYMSNHPDTLVAYAKYYGKVTAPISNAELTDINTKNMTLLCNLKSGAKQTTTITFNPPLAGYNDVKPRLLEMKSIAQEKLGMIKTPRISSFEFPPLALVTAPVIIVLSFLYFLPDAKLAEQAFEYLTPLHVQRGLGATVLFHGLESIYTLVLCKRHQTGLGLGALHVISTLICGFPILINLRKRIQKARIDSVMKVE